MNIGIEKKSLLILIAIFVAYGLLVSTHDGEFWPFSIYPMFSRAGRPWTRVLVRKVGDEVQRNPNWSSIQRDPLIGQSFEMDRFGIDQNDVSAMLQKTKQWDSERISGLRRIFDSALNDDSLLLFCVIGQFGDNSRDSVIVNRIPFALFLQDTTLLNPDIIRL